MTKTVILYHKNCTDGTGSKYAAWKKFGDTAEYYACQYGQPLPNFEQSKDVEVFMLDYSTSRIELKALREACGRVVVVDHHKTAREALEGLEDVVFDMNKSGAVLAWEYFHPGKPVPTLLKRIQDRDLWKFQYRDTEAIHAGLGTLKGSMEKWDEYNVPHEIKTSMSEPIVGGPLTELIKKGVLLLDRDKDVVKSQVPENVKVADFLGYKCGFLNNGSLVSEFCHAIYSDETLKVDIGVCWFVTKNDVVILSMRSKKDTDVDVSKLCKQFGGGGHKHSAGCRTDLGTLKLILEGKLAQPIQE